GPQSTKTRKRATQPSRRHQRARSVPVVKWGAKEFRGWGIMVKDRLGLGEQVGKPRCLLWPGQGRGRGGRLFLYRGRPLQVYPSPGYKFGHPFILHEMA